MKLLRKPDLTEAEIETALGNVVNHGLASQAMVTLTGGAFLVGLALKLGASNTTIGLLAAITPLMQLLQIPSVYLIEKTRARQAICLYTAAAARLPWLLVALIPFVFPATAGTTVLVIALILSAGLGAPSNAAWNPWMRDLVPPERLGRFFGRRMSLSTGFGIVVGLLGGFYIDLSKSRFPEHEIYSYSVLYFLGFLAGVVAVYYLLKIPDRGMVPSEEAPGLFALLSRPFKDANFRRLIQFLGSWNFAVNLAAPFFTVYMLERLGLSMAFVVSLLVLSQVANLVFFRIWGRFSDRYSHKSVLRVSGPLFIMCILGWTFTTMPERHVLTIPLLLLIHALMGISTAGVTLASGNIGLKLAPRGQATAYLAATVVANSVAAGIAPIVGGRFVDFFADRELSWTMRWTSPGQELEFQTLDFQHWDFFFFLAFVLGLLSLHRLASVREVGEVEERIVVNELLSEVRRRMMNLSTVGGLRRMVQFPFAILKYTNRVRNNRRKNSGNREGPGRE